MIKWDTTGRPIYACALYDDCNKCKTYRANHSGLPDIGEIEQYFSLWYSSARQRWRCDTPETREEEKHYQEYVWYAINSLLLEIKNLNTKLSDKSNYV